MLVEEGGVGRGRGPSIESTRTNVGGGRGGWVEGKGLVEGEVDQLKASVQMLVVGGGWVEGVVHQLKAPVQMLVEGGGWVEGEVEQIKAPLQILVVVVGGVGRGRGRSI